VVVVVVVVVVPEPEEERLIDIFEKGGAQPNATK
jgi:hypothetical protein